MIEKMQKLRFLLALERKLGLFQQDVDMQIFVAFKVDRVAQREALVALVALEGPAEQVEQPLPIMPQVREALVALAEKLLFYKESN